LLAAGAASGATPVSGPETAGPERAGPSARQEALVEGERDQLPIELYRRERVRFDRIRTTGLPASYEARQAFWRALLEASDRWIARWPEREFAWRDRLQALAELSEVAPGLVEQAADGALAAMREDDGIRFLGDDTRLRIARAYVRHGVRLGEVRPLLRAALATRSDDRARTAALRVESALAIAEQDIEALRSLLIRLRRGIAAPGLSAAERAGRERDYRLAAAWLSRFAGRTDAVVEQLQRAFDVRPVYRKRPGARDAIQPQNEELHAQGRRLWTWSGRAPEAWDAWVGERRGFQVTASRGADSK